MAKRKIKLVRALGRELAKTLGLDAGECGEGCRVEVDGETAEHLIALDLAERVGGRAKSVQAVPDNPVRGVDDNESIHAAEASVANYKEKATAKKTKD